MSLLYCLIYIAFIGALSFLLGRILPKRWFSYRAFPYRTWEFEDDGRIYHKIKIHRWHAVVPDMSRLLPKFMPEKRIKGRPNDAQLMLLLRETCVAEFIHWTLSISGLYILKIWPGVGGVVVFTVYFVLGNLPFILIQRYNRPRLAAMLKSYRKQVERRRSKHTKEQKKILILSCNTGEGHNSCAKAIKEVFDARNMTCDIVDALQFISPRISRIVSNVHVYIYRRHPRLFRFGYRFSEKHPGMFKEGSWPYNLLAFGCDPMASYIFDGAYDIVISTHVFTALMLTVSQKRHDMKVHTSFVATDYTRSPSMERSDLDLYFVPDASLVRDFTIPPITREKIIDCGIPVRQVMYHCAEKVFAKRHYEIPEDARHLLIMCGSMGCGPLKWLISLLVMEQKEDQYITVVCGTNKDLKDKLSRRYKHNKRVRIYGFRDDISLLMDSADLYLTKPGGLSVTEAAIKNLPMVMINAVAGCEEYNKNFFVKCGLGVTSDSIWSLSRLCMDILSDDESLRQLQEAGRRKPWQNASQVICRRLLNEEDNPCEPTNICSEKA